MSDEEEPEPETAKPEIHADAYVIKSGPDTGDGVHIDLDAIASTRPFDRDHLPDKFETADILGMNEYDVEWVREQLADDDARLAQFEAAYEKVTAPIRFKIATDLPKYDFGIGPIKQLAETITASAKINVKPLDPHTITGMRNLSDMILSSQASATSQIRADLSRLYESTAPSTYALNPSPGILDRPSAVDAKSRSAPAKGAEVAAPTIAETLAIMEKVFGPVGLLISQMVDVGKGQLAILEKQTKIVEQQSEANRIESGFGLFISCVFVATLVVTIHSDSEPWMKWLLTVVSCAVTFAAWKLYERRQKKRLA